MSSSIREFTGPVSDLFHPTEKTASRHREKMSLIEAGARTATKGATERRRVTQLNRRLLPVLTEAVEFAEHTGVPTIMRGATYALKAATPPKKMRDINVCRTQLRYAALAATSIVEGLEEIARGFNSREEGNKEIRQEARRLQARIRKMTAHAARVVANIRD